MFPRLQVSIWQNCRQKVHETAERSRFAFKHAKKLTEAFGALLEDKARKMCTRV